MAWSKDEFKQQILALEPQYHIHHPYQVAMAQGKLSREQMQAWVANRFYYQINIPRKDAAILANCPDRDFRAKWVERIRDHDGHAQDPGGIEAWLMLGQACGLERQALLSQQHVLPGVKFAVDAYVNFARNGPWQEAVASSLTELFAPSIHQQRLDTWPDKYPWIETEGLQYFKNRLKQARRDVEHGLEFTLKHFTTLEQQQRVIEVVTFKCNVLWSLADTIEHKFPVQDHEFEN